jgi:predicted protein tyrosine phosphatase
MPYPKLDICAVDKVDGFIDKSPTHLISIRNPGSPSARPVWFKGHFLELFFGDVVSEADAQVCRTMAPNVKHIGDAIHFSSAAFDSLSAKMLIFCDYGASRSPALGYVVLAALAGAGHETECFQHLVDICPNAVPNLYVVRLGDSYLSRKGALLAPCQNYVRKLFQGLI